MSRSGAVLLDRSHVARHLALDRCIEVVEAAFRAHGERRIPAPAIAGVVCDRGSFHIKAGLFRAERDYFAAKLNANFMANRGRGLPTIQGVIALCDAETGTLLALMDSIEVTALRTGAATAVAARYLARADAQTVAICGCGTQGRAQLRALTRVRSLQKAYVYDTDRSIAERFADELSGELARGIEVVGAVDDAISAGDICVTCTPARAPFVRASAVRPGTFVAAVGADAEYKQEIDPDVFTRAVVIADVLTQSAAIGDLHHALRAGALALSDVYAELGEIVIGSKAGRTSAEQITVFDSTGMAIQDVAVAAWIYESIEAAGEGALRFVFNA